MTRFSTLAALLVAAPFASAAAQSSPGQAAPVQVSGAWVRATAPHQDEAAAYMTLTSRDDDRLTGVEAQQAGMAMLHTTAQEAGVMRMREADGLSLPAGQPVALSPGGTHVMLGGLQAPLRAGQVVAMTLRFAHAPALQVQVPVLPIGANGPASGGARR